MDQIENGFDFGMIGLGTMGRNLLLNIADHGYSSIGYDRDADKGKLLESEATSGAVIKAAGSLAEMLQALKTPRKIMLLVPAGPVVDAVISELLPLVEAGDIIIDGGNSHYTDTLKRIQFLSGKKIHFMGMGISGGETGARLGPSIMPGGDREAWLAVRGILEAVSARAGGEPCVAYMGKGAAGHYVKMVHNGIEYAIMQLISETYDILKRGLGFTNAELKGIFSEWNDGDYRSFLLEITSTVFSRKDELTGNDLVDMILDKAGSKGTGKWTSQDAMDLPVPVPSIDIAVSMRDLSTFKEERVRAAAIHKASVKQVRANPNQFVTHIRDGLYAATLLSYVQGLAMLYRASAELKMEIPLAEVVRIWRGGCIIRSAALEIFAAAYKKDKALANLLLDKKIASLMRKKIPALRKVIRESVASKIPVTGMMSALGYYDAYCSERMPVNLVQAQRDLFGAHTYQRIDREGSFHTDWEKEDKI